MSSWTERARNAFSQKGQYGTVETDETTVSRLLAVSSVTTKAVCQTPDRLSAVLAVPIPFENAKHDVSSATNYPVTTTTTQVVIADSGDKFIDIGTVRPPDLSPTLLAASLALDAYIVAVASPGTNK